MSEWISRRYQELSTKDLKTSKFTQQDFQLRKTIEHGVPTNAKVLAWDPVQELLALGTTDGCVIVYGKFNVDQRFQLNGSLEINFLFFRTNEGYIIAITSDSCIHICSLHHRGEVETYSLGKNVITSICTIPGYSFIYIGDEVGGVRVFDTKSKKMASYEIRLSDVLPGSDRITVVDIQGHPDDVSKILIGYFTGDIVLWDLKTRKMVRSCTHKIKGLSALSWSRSGDQFASGYHNGEVIIWNSRNFEISYHAITIGGPKNIVRSPIKKLYWSMPSVKERSVIYAIGGVILPNEPEDSVISIFGPSYTEYHFAHIGKVHDFILTSVNPWSNGADDPQSLVTLPSEGGLQMYRILPLGFPPLLAPSIYNLNSSRIFSTDYQPECPKEFIDDLREILIETDRESIKLIQEYWPMKNGGHTSPQKNDSHAILATGHTDGFVRIWDVSNAQVSLIAHFDALKMLPKKPSVHSINLIRVCAISRTILVGFLGGEAHVFKFKKIVSKPAHLADHGHEASRNASSEQLLKETTTLTAPDKAPVISVSSAASKARLAKLSGFSYANVSVTHQGRFTSAIMHSGLKKLALGDDSGQLSVTDLDSGVCLIKCSLGDRRSPVLGLSIADLATSVNARSTSPTLFVSLEIGSVYCLDLNTFEITLNLKPSGISPVLSCFVLDENAQPLVIPPQVWKPVYEEEQSSEPAVEEKQLAQPEATQIPETHENVTVEQTPENILSVAEENELEEKAVQAGETVAEADDANVEGTPEPQNDTAADKDDAQSSVVNEPTLKMSGQDSIEQSFVVISSNTTNSSETFEPSEEKKSSAEPAPKTPATKESNSRRFGFFSSFIGRMSNTETKSKEDEPKNTGDSNDDRSVGNKASTQITFPTRYMVQVCSKFIRLYTFPAQARLIKITPTNDVVWASLINYFGDVCLFTFDCANTITIYALLDLKVVATLNPENDGLIFESDMRFRTCVFEDGRVITSLDGAQISRFSIILEENMLNLPAALPTPFTPSRVLPQRPAPSGLMGRLLGGFNSQTDLYEIFPLESSARSRLFGDRQEQGRSSSGSSLSQANESNTPAAVNEQTQSVASAVNETRDLLVQRGERLSELQNATSQLESQALTFLQLAREMRQQQQNKSWWEL